MNIKLKQITIGEVISGYTDNAEGGVIGYGGKLDIRPAYQREFVYKDQQRNEVIRTILRGYPNAEFPLNVMYWAETSIDHYELIDGQQRTISLCQYANSNFSIIVDGIPQNFDNLSKEKQEYFLNYKLQVYICEGTSDEKLDWFTIINVAGEPLKPQELLNANYTGPWLTSAKQYFMKSNSPAYLLGNKYIDIEANQSRGKGLETAIKWISNDDVKQYMADHQNNDTANELWRNFKTIIEWIQSTFPVYHREMKGLNWDQLYEKYHKQTYEKTSISDQVQKLYENPYIRNPKGIFEYVLGGSIDTRLLEIRVFEDAAKRSVYALQTNEAKAVHKSNCPLCAVGHEVNKSKLWELEEMEADHVAAWSKNGATSIENCQMLCVTHNRAKGNR